MKRGLGKLKHAPPLLAVLLATLARAYQPAAAPSYVDPKLCIGCHAEIAQTYRKTGMGRSFYRPSPANTVEDYTRNHSFYHQPSDTQFTMLIRDGKYIQRRFQKLPDGREVNIEEKSVDYVMGSGNHARTYLHRTARGTLVELPLGWYAEKGGYWAMNPGYDRPDQPNAHREISYDCMFCHNAYPQIPAAADTLGADPVLTGALPEGIDCQRCHGPGSRHVQIAQIAGAKTEDIHAAIVNPKRLSAERQMDVCMQCHLETTSFPFPHSIVRYNRGSFSYKPGEALSGFELFYDHPAGAGQDDKFEIAGAAYRLRKSACFVKSAGTLSCTTCHNPHDVGHGQEAKAQYNATCRKCHAAAFDADVKAGRHLPLEDCTGCHMPKRRTDDAVHVVMTDHYIQRAMPARGMENERPERHDSDSSMYHGEVAPYLVDSGAGQADDELYNAVGQVWQKNNLKDGLPRLASLIDAKKPSRAEFYLLLADAWRDFGQVSKAVPQYDEALRRKPDWLYAQRKLAVALDESGQGARAVELLRRATVAQPRNSAVWHQYGQTLMHQGRNTEASAALHQALALDPEIYEAHNSLGVLAFGAQDLALAEQSFREAVRLAPENVEALTNLAHTLAWKDPPDAAVSAWYFERAITLHAGYAPAQFGYADLLNTQGRFAEALPHVEAALAADPKMPEAHELMGNLWERQGRLQQALEEYRTAVRLNPQFYRAQLYLGDLLARTGDAAGAVEHLQAASKSPDTMIRDLAVQRLGQVRK
jgi:tetratricopeptide (TPR) repeat protein